MCKPRTIAENLALPATVDMLKAVIGPEDARILKTIPLSNNAGSSRIDEMADDVHEQLMQKIKESDFITVQFDELTKCFESDSFDVL